MDDLAQWYSQQLDEDERIAQGAGGAGWEELPVSGWVHTSPLPTSEWQPPGYDHHVASAPLPADRAHIVEHDPARVLCEIDAKRRLIADLLAEPHASVRPGGSTWIYCDADSDPEGSCECGRDERVNRRIRLLALPYADRPGYLESWRP